MWRYKLLKGLTMKKLLTGLLAVSSLAVLAACSPATTVKHNISTAADNFEILRRIVFINGITDKYIIEVTGLCSTERTGTQLNVTCKNGNKDYRVHRFGLSDNSLYLVEQIAPAGVSEYHTRIVFRPQAIIPDVDFQGDLNELTTNRNTDG